MLLKIKIPEADELWLHFNWNIGLNITIVKLNRSVIVTNM
jgi:hypothetical protein